MKKESFPTLCLSLIFVQVVTEEERCVCHFFHQDFERCRILDKHLAILSKKYFDTRFIKLSAPVSSPSAGLPKMSTGSYFCG